MTTQHGAPPIVQAFRSLESQALRALAYRGIADIVLVLSAVILGSFCLDVLFEFPWIARLLTLLAAVGLYAWLLWLHRRRSRVSLDLADLMKTVEHFDPVLDGHLMNAGELRRDFSAATHGGRSDLELHLLRQALRESHEVISNVEVERALDWWPLWRRAGAAVALVGVLGILLFTFPAEFRLWAERNVLLFNTPWPRGTHFAADREGDVWHHTRDEPLEIVAWVVGDVPRELFLHVESEGRTRKSRVVPGQTRSATWNLCSVETSGGPAPEAEVSGHRLSYIMPAVLDSFRFFFSGGDNRSRVVRVEVHEQPRLLSTRLRLKYPPHTGQEERVLENPAGEVSVPKGTVLELRAEWDQVLKVGWARFGGDGRVPVSVVDEKALEHRIVLETSGFLEVTGTNVEWSLESKPWRLPLVVTPDQEPQVTFVVLGEHRVVTPNGTIHYKVEVRDDYGVSELELEVGDPRSIAQGDEAELVKVIDLSPWEAIREERGVAVNLDRVLKLEPFVLEPGQQVALRVAVTDNDRPAGLKTTYSQMETFDVMSGDELVERMDKLRVQMQGELEELSHGEKELAGKLAEWEGERPDVVPPSETEGLPPELQQIAESQREIARGARQVGQQLQGMMDALADNDLADEAEEARMEDEVARPLRELSDEELPRSAGEIEAISRADRPSEALRRAEHDLEEMADGLDELSKTLAGSGDFREVLNRLQTILELQQRVIQQTSDSADRVDSEKISDVEEDEP